MYSLVEKLKGMKTEYEEIIDKLQGITAQTDSISAKIQEDERTQSVRREDHMKKMTRLETSLRELKTRYEEPSMTSRKLPQIPTGSRRKFGR